MKTIFFIVLICSQMSIVDFREQCFTSRKTSASAKILVKWNITATCKMCTNKGSWETCTCPVCQDECKIASTTHTKGTICSCKPCLKICNYGLWLRIYGRTKSKLHSTSRLKCRPGDKYGGNSQCVYPPQKEKPHCKPRDKFKNGLCRYPSQQDPGVAGKKRPLGKCLPGHKHENGKCVYLPLEGKKRCRKGDKLINGKCSYPAQKDEQGGEKENRPSRDSGKCRSGDKFEKGKCVYPPLKGKKHCKKGDEYINSKCRYPAQKGEPGWGGVKNLPSNDSKKCRPSDKNENGVCVYSPLNVKEHCKKGDKFIKGKCRYPAQKGKSSGGGKENQPSDDSDKCHPGDKYEKGECVYPPLNGKEHCKKGDKFIKGKCRYPAQKGKSSGGGEKHKPSHDSYKCHPGDKYESGECVYPPLNGKKHCKNGDKFINGICRYPAQKSRPGGGGSGGDNHRFNDSDKCRPGDKYEKGECVYPPLSGKKRCKKGDKYINGKCRYPAQKGEPVGGGGGKKNQPSDDSAKCWPGDKYENGECVYSPLNENKRCRSEDRFVYGKCKYPAGDISGGGGGEGKHPSGGSLGCHPGDKIEGVQCTYPLHTNSWGKKFCSPGDKYLHGKCTYPLQEKSSIDKKKSYKGRRKDLSLRKTKKKKIK